MIVRAAIGYRMNKCLAVLNVAPLQAISSCIQLRSLAALTLPVNENVNHNG